jgi:hypothetical protein
VVTLARTRGKQTTREVFLYTEKLQDVDMKVLEKLAREPMKWIRKNYS